MERHCRFWVSAFQLIQSLGGFDKETFITRCNKFYERQLKRKYGSESVIIVEPEPDIVTFFYENPFRVSNIHPRTDILFKNRKTLEAKDENILVFGMLDAEFKVVGDRVVYDPQTSDLQTRFSSTGSVAKELVIVLNYSEAKRMSGKESLIEIRDVLFNEEHCTALIVKMGVRGAVLFRNTSDEGMTIPVYKTNKVNLIGSGDIFTGYFVWSWFQGNSLEESAINASRAVACYSESHVIESIGEDLSKYDFEELVVTCKESKQVYLAGPFFTYAQRWLVNEFYTALRNIGVSVFSPYHDVGLGDAKQVTDLDLQGLDKSSIIFAIVDGMDSGTIFEVGYAKAKAKNVIIYSEQEYGKSIQMMEGTHCEIVNSFTEAVYKVGWYAFS